MQRDMYDNPGELMRRFQTSKNTMFLEPIILKYSPSALFIARKYLKNAEMAEDAVQETFLKIIQKNSHFDPKMDFSAWFFTILRNVCCDIHRKKQRFTEKLNDISYFYNQLQTGNLPEAEVGGAEAVLAGLSESERSVLLLRVVHELSFKEIAAAMGISEDAAKKRGQRGLRRLREKYHSEKTAAAERA